MFSYSHQANNQTCTESVYAVPFRLVLQIGDVRYMGKLARALYPRASSVLIVSQATKALFQFKH
jgi:hypothetical protein